MKLRRDGGRLLRIGHRGAAALGPPNSIAAIEAAIGAGVDIVEVDVLRLSDRLVLSHSDREAASEPATLDDALALVAAAGVGVQLDVKAAGIERALVEAVRRHELLDRALVSTTDVPVLRELAMLEPQLPRSVTYPRSRARAAGLRRVPAALPVRIGRLVTAVGAAAATLQYRVVTPGVVARCHALGAAVLVWTVNDRSVVQRLEAIGVDGIITDDPGVFGATLQA